eukprot:16939-Heterococcus_DN1.PRE.2
MEYLRVLVQLPERMLELPAMKGLLVSEACCDDRAFRKARAQDLLLLAPFAKTHVFQVLPKLQQLRAVGM